MPVKGQKGHWLEVMRFVTTAPSLDYWRYLQKVGS